MTAPTRRRFRWSLRTMFVVVTVICVLLSWVGWNWGQVRERERLIQFFLESDVQSESRQTLWLHHHHKGIEQAEPPWLWRLMGATHFYGNMLREVKMSDEELDRLQRRAQVVLPDYELTIIPPPTH